MDLRYKLFKGHLEEGEEIFEIVRKHWFVMYSSFMKVLMIGFAVPIVLYLVFPVSFFFWMMWVWCFLGLLKFAYAICNWYLDAWLLTNMAIIDVKWDGFFKRSAQRIEYQSIEQVSYAFNGIWQTIYNYGTLQIQQPGGVTSIDDIEKPKEVASHISKYQEQFVSGQKFEDEESLKDILTGLIKRHVKRHGLQVNIDEDEQ